jgi:hypothetical protein
MMPRLWSIAEFMRHYNVWQLAHSVRFLTDVKWEASYVCDHGEEHTRVPQERVDTYFGPLLNLARLQIETLELKAAIVRCNLFAVALRDGLTWNDLRVQTTVLIEAIDGELCFRRFAFVLSAKAEIHDRLGSDWNEIWTKFPEAKDDSKSAVDCYALEQNTACVFHLMRVAEIGLRAIAKNVGVRLTDKRKPMPVEYATWEKVLSAIKSKIDAAHTLPKGPRKSARLRFYSDAADQCAHFRDIWRNNVAHTRKPYNEGEAFGVMTRVREFMELLAKELK